MSRIVIEVTENPFLRYVWHWTSTVPLGPFATKLTRFQTDGGGVKGLSVLIALRVSDENHNCKCSTQALRSI